MSEVHLAPIIAAHCLGWPRGYSTDLSEVHLAPIIAAYRRRVLVVGLCHLSEVHLAPIIAARAVLLRRSEVSPT